MNDVESSNAKLPYQHGVLNICEEGSFTIVNQLLGHLKRVHMG
jgi:hypothetical protein